MAHWLNEEHQMMRDTVTAKLVLASKDEERNTCVFTATVTNQKGTVVSEGQTYLKVL